MLKFIKPNRYRLLLGTIYLISFIGIGLVIAGVYSAWWLLAGLIWSKIIQLIGHSIGMHRYFSHKSFNTTLRGEKVMAWFSFLLGVGSPIQYARNHRQHHRVSDQPSDWHSPKNDGKLYTALGLWEFNSLKWFMERGGITPRDLLVHPTYMFIHTYYYQMWIALLIASALISLPLMLFLVALPSLIYHIELNVFVNFTGHCIGYRNFETTDTSRNNNIVQWWTLGEGLHNNHHAVMRLYDFAVLPEEFDVSAFIIDKFFAVPGKQTLAGRIKANVTELRHIKLDKY
jgi:stearoyl-CoA desaturase (delta-9 desaturase)